MRSYKLSKIVSESDPAPRRVWRVAVVLGVWTLLVVGRLLYLQVWQHGFLSEYARDQQQGTYQRYGQRGVVLDRAGRELARSIWAESVYVEPRRVDDVNGAARRLAPLLKMPEAELASKLSRAKNSRRAYLSLARRVEDNVADRIRALNLKGVGLRMEAKRVYRNGTLAAHVLGFVGDDNTGLAGVESASNQQLQGAVGEVQVEKDGRGQVYESWEKAPEDGRSLVLTLDTTVQYRTEQVLAAEVARTKAKSGMAVVMDPRTGGILALANVPTFDPNEPFPDDEDKTPAEAKADKLRYINQALQYVYEPGSTFKVVAYSGALEEGLTSTKERLRCGGVTRLGNIAIKDGNASGVLPLADALAKSSNTAAITLGRRLGQARMYDYIKRFGFGARSGVELKGESKGILRDVKGWSGASIGSLSIGQEIGITPIQLASAYAAIANDGVRVTPHLVKEVQSAAGVTIAKTQPAKRRVVSSETAATLRKMLEGVTLRGTAKLAQLSNGYTAAGKTGTAQKYDPRLRRYSQTRHIASFVGFAPVEKPQAVIVVVIDEPQGADHGGEVAAPIFRMIAEQVLPVLSVAPGEEAPFITPQQRAEVKRSKTETLSPAPEDKAPGVTTKPQEDGSGQITRAPGTKNGFVMPDLRGKSVAEVTQICTQLGFEMQMSGSGRAMQQFPSAGAEVKPGQQVRVEFGGP